jgi:hypothetical protein
VCLPRLVDGVAVMFMGHLRFFYGDEGGWRGRGLIPCYIVELFYRRGLEDAVKEEIVSLRTLPYTRGPRRQARYSLCGRNVMLWRCGCCRMDG